MKCIVEFGVRGGAHTQNLKVPTEKLAISLATKLVMVFCNDPYTRGASLGAWPMLNKSGGRLSWQSETHFVAVSLLDGVPRGPASAALWRKGPTILLGVVH